MLLIVGTGCSSTKFAYNQLDWYVTKEYNEFLNLRSDRKDELRAAVERYFAQHRKKALPKWSSFSKEFAVRLEDGDFPEDDAKWLMQQMAQLYYDSAALAVPETAKFSLSLTAEERAEYLKNWRENHRELLREMNEETEEDDTEGKYKFATRILDFFVGSPTDEQEKLIRNMVKQWPQEGGLEWSKFNTRQTLAYFELLEKKKEQKEVERFLTNWIVYTHRSRTPKHQAIVDLIDQTAVEFLPLWTASLTEKQRRRLISKLKSMSEDFEELSKEPED